MDTTIVSGYQDFLLHQLQHMQSEKTLCDVQLTTQEGHVCAHKVVLMAASPYFQTRLSKQLSQEMKMIYFDDVSLSILQIVIHFIYSGELRCSSDNIENLVILCKQLDLTSAVKASQEFLGSKKTSENEYAETNINDSDTVNVTEAKVICVKQSNKLGKRSKHGTTGSENNEPADKKKIVSKPLENEQTLKRTTRGGLRKPKTRKNHKQRKPSKTALNDPIADKHMEIKSGKASEVKNDSEAEVTDLKEMETERNDYNYEINLTIDYDCNNDTDVEIDSGSEKPEKYSDNNRDNAGDKRVKKRQRKAVLKTSHAGESEKKQNQRNRKIFPCSMCKRILTSHKRLVFHQFSKHGNPYDENKYNMYPCKEKGCTHVAASRHNLETHMKSRHGKERPHICEFCGKGFKLPNVLATHLNIHTGKKVFKCETCGESFNQQSGLDVHIKRHHIGESSWAELCHLCSEKFLQKSELAWHLYKTHDQPLPDRYKAYVCFICEYQTKSSQDLQRHQNAHEGIKQFNCPICKKACSTKSELKRHVSFHGEKKYKCTFDGCNYACTDTIGLKKHIKLMHTHKNYKPYICPVCPYKTGVKGNLDKHIRTVHNLEVVTKHTIQLKMKYSNFESGDIITKEGNLIASAQDRKALQDQYHAENPDMFDSSLNYDPDNSVVNSSTTDVNSSILSLPEKTLQPFVPFSDTINSIQSSRQSSIESMRSLAHSANIQSAEQQFTPLANCIYVEGSQAVASFEIPVVAEDLRIPIANQVHVATHENMYRDPNDGEYAKQKLQYKD